MTAAPPPASIVLIGAGPTGSSLLERLFANVSDVWGDRPLQVHLVDPHRAGLGRVWRPDLHPLLWMNSLAEDVTMFTDESVRCSGPIRPGPSLIEWARTISDDELRTLGPAHLVDEVHGLDGASFPTRLVQSAYLEWFHRRTVASAPENVTVTWHPTSAVDLVDLADGRQRVTLATGEVLDTDTVVLALGHLDAEAEPDSVVHTDFAARHGLTWIGPGHTGELDLSALRAGEDVLVLGFGQAFTDLVVLLTEGRGGRFVPRPDGWLDYEPSGDEPVLHVGSRRGVPYRSKLDYRLQAPLAPLPRFLDASAIERLVSRVEPLDFRADILPLIEKEVAWAYYHELFHAHPERTTGSWDVVAARFDQLDWGDKLQRTIAAAVPDPADRFDITALDRPLAGHHSDSVGAFQAHLRDHIVADVARRTDPAYSADLGAFMGLLLSFGTVAQIGASGRLTPRSRVEDLSGWWFSFFMYFASGPPPARLRQFAALADAGLLRFLGADVTISGDDDSGRFVATSSSHPDRVSGTAFVDARIAGPSVSRSRDLLVRRLAERGELVEETVTDGEWSANTGKAVMAGADMRLARRDGSAHPRRHGLGAFTNRPAAGAFARPRTNAPSFRQNDLVARSILASLAVAVGRDDVVSNTSPVR